MPHLQAHPSYRAIYLSAKISPALACIEMNSIVMAEYYIIIAGKLKIFGCKLFIILKRQYYLEDDSMCPKPFLINSFYKKIKNVWAIIKT